MPATCVRLAYKVSSVVYKSKNGEGKGQGREGEVGREKRAVGSGADRTRAPGSGKVKGEWKGCHACCSAKCMPGG